MEAKKIEETKKVEETKKLEAKKLEETKKVEEAKKVEEEKKKTLAKKKEEVWKFKKISPNPHTKQFAHKNHIRSPFSLKPKRDKLYINCTYILKLYSESYI